MATKVTLIGGPYDGDTRDFSDDYGVNGVVIPEGGRVHIYRYRGDVHCIGGDVHRYLDFEMTIKGTFPRRGEK